LWYFNVHWRGGSNAVAEQLILARKPILPAFKGGHEMAKATKNKIKK